MVANGHAVQPQAMIQIALLPDGQVVSSYTGPNRPIFNMMMETARQDIIEKLRAKEQGPRIEAAPPGLRVQ